MRLSLYYGLPFLRRDFCLRRILAVRIWRNLLFLIGCVIGSREEHLCLVHVLCWSSDVCLMLSAVCYWSSVWCLWCEPKWTCSEVERCWMLSTICCWSSILFWGLWFGFSLSFVVSEIDHCLLVGIHQIFGFWNGSFKCSLLTLLWIHQTFVSEMDPGSVVVRTFSC